MMKILWVVLCLNLFGRIQGSCDKCGSLLECRGLTQDDAKFVRTVSDDVIEVSFSGGNLTVISPNLFETLDGIKSAFLVNNSIRIISNDTFSNLKQLEELDLSVNEIQILKRRFFRTNPNLQWISLKENQISRIESGTFSRLTKLTFIDLSANNLEVLPSYLFYNNVKLLSVNLSNNKLRRIEDNIIRLGLTPVSINLCNNYEDGGNRNVVVPQILRNFVLQQNAPVIEEKIIEKVEQNRSGAVENFVRNVLQSPKSETKYIFVNSLPIVEAIVVINASISTCLFLYGAFNVVMLFFYRDSDKKSISRKEIGQSILRRTYLKRKT